MRAITLLLLCSFFALPALAEPPIPPKKEIDQLDEKLKEGKANKKELEKELKNIEGTLEDTKGSLVKTAKAVQRNEKELQNLDLKIAELEKKEKALNESLQSDRGDIARLILALERIRRLPPEAMIARPEAPLKTAQSAMLLEEILPALNKQAENLKTTLADLKDVSEDLKNKRAVVISTSKELEEQQKELNSLVKKRTDLYASTQKDLKSQQAKVAQISAQAKNLQDLVKRLDNERTASKSSSAGKVVGASIPKPGQPRLPLPGIIKVGFNDPDNFGAPSQGIDIEGREGALVVAPMGGVVRFAGYFKNYGNMLIIEHEKGWHSLVAGLENIDTVVGQSVNVGEPLGVLHKSSSGQKPVLYYELRYKGKPVNPAKKFGDLS